MASEIVLPQIGFSVTEGKIVEWYAADGATVEQGALLFSLESDKAVQDIEAPVSGVLKILAAAGETRDVGAVIGLIE